MQLFISYSSQDTALVEKLDQSLKNLEHETWFAGNSLQNRGGHEWWSEICDTILEYDVFVVALTPNFLKSDTCSRELEYAVSLEKRILPILLLEVNHQDLPPTIAPKQWVDFLKEDDAALSRLNNSLIGLPPAVPLPNPLPKRPNYVFTSPIITTIRHQSLIQIPNKAIETCLPSDWRGLNLREFVIDQVDLTSNHRMENLDEAVRRQAEKLGLLDKHLEVYPNSKIVYYGLAHIPLIFWAGCHLTDKRPVHCFDFNNESQKWDLLNGNRGDQKVEVVGLPEKAVLKSGEVILRVTISYEIADHEILEVVPSSITSVHLKINSPIRNTVTSQAQIDDYSAKFREVLDSIHNLLPMTERIHLFYAGPVSLALNLGRQISRTIHPSIVVYNRHKEDSPKYSWGIDVTKAFDDKRFVVKVS